MIDFIQKLFANRKLNTILSFIGTCIAMLFNLFLMVYWIVEIVVMKKYVEGSDIEANNALYIAAIISVNKAMSYVVLIMCVISASFSVIAVIAFITGLKSKVSGNLYASFAFISTILSTLFIFALYRSVTDKTPKTLLLIAFVLFLILLIIQITRIKQISNDALKEDN